MGRERERKKKGCIKGSKGPWVVRREGGVVTKLRFPSEKEREKNQEREKKRRELASKIFSGLRAHGNYNLPKHADSNDLLKALCHEAGWHVDQDGTISKKGQGGPPPMPHEDPDTTLTLSLSLVPS